MGICLRAVSELTVGVVSPSVDEVVSDCQAVCVSGSDVGDVVEQATDRHRHVAYCVIAIAQLAIPVVTPRSDRSVIHDGVSRVSIGIDTAGVAEAHPHDVKIMRESPNYRS